MENELAIRIAALTAASQAVSGYASVIHRAELYATWLREGLGEGSEELAQAEAALVTNPCAYGPQTAVQDDCQVCGHVHQGVRCGHVYRDTPWDNPCDCHRAPFPAARNGDAR